MAKKIITYTSFSKKLKALNPSFAPTKTKGLKRSAAVKNGYRSGFEEDFSTFLNVLGIKHDFESTKIKYIEPETKHTYTPDFDLRDTCGFIVETKGRFVLADRKKHLLIKAQHPDLDIRFVFQNAKTKISKKSKTTYASWCDKHGFKWAEKTLPTAWINFEKCSNVQI